jgi:hypothetical protein
MSKSIYTSITTWSANRHRSSNPSKSPHPSVVSWIMLTYIDRARGYYRFVHVEDAGGSYVTVCARQLN